MADHSVGARDEYESEASEALVLCFDNRPLSRNAETKDFARLTSHPVRG